MVEWKKRVNGSHNKKDNSRREGPLHGKRFYENPLVSFFLFVPYSIASHPLPSSPSVKPITAARGAKKNGEGRAEESKAFPIKEKCIGTRCNGIRDAAAKRHPPPSSTVSLGKPPCFSLDFRYRVRLDPSSSDHRSFQYGSKSMMGSSLGIDAPLPLATPRPSLLLLYVAVREERKRKDARCEPTVVLPEDFCAPPPIAATKGATQS